MYNQVNLEVVNYCNAKCKWCKTGRKNRNEGKIRSDKIISLEVLNKAIGYLLDHSIIETNAIVELFNWGEAFFHPKIVEILELLCESGLRIGLSTNGSRYIDIPVHVLPNIEYLIISISGFSEKSYENIHGLNFNSVLDNIKKFADLFNSNGYSGKVIMNFHVYQYNMQEITDAEMFAYNNNVIFSPHLAYIADESLFLEYLNNSLGVEILREASKEILFGLIEQIKEKVVVEDFVCPQKERLVLDEKMNIIPCCLFNSEDAVGNLFDFQTFEEIKQRIEKFEYCSKCIKLKQAQIIHSPMMEFSYQNKIFRSKIYYADNIEEFSENKTITSLNIANGQAFTMEVVLPQSANYIRFDPVEGRKSILIDLEFFIKGERYVSEIHNGTSIDNLIMFETTDPWVIIKNVPNERKVKISGKCVWY